MADKKTPDGKTLSVGGKSTLSLKPRSETGIVRQSFSHGRSKQIVVEVKKKPDAPVVSAPPPRAVLAAKPVAAATPRSSGVVLRTLSEDERNRRAHALGDARLREAEERKIAEEERKIRLAREVLERERVAAQEKESLWISTTDRRHRELREKFLQQQDGEAALLEAISRVQKVSGLGDDQAIYLAELGALNAIPDLSRFPNLIAVNLAWTQVQNLEPLRPLENLRSLNLAGTRVVDISPLAGMKNLEILVLWGAPISDITPLSHLKNLRVIDLEGTQIRNLDPMRSLKRLETIDVRNTGISDINQVSKLAAIRNLRISNTFVSDLSPVAGLAKLVEGAKSDQYFGGLSFAKCPVDDEDISALGLVPNPDRTIDSVTLLRGGKAEIEEQRDQGITEEESDELPLPPAEAIPKQLAAAISFTSAVSGPLSIIPDRESEVDPEQAELYSRMRRQLDDFVEQIPSQEREQVKVPIDDFLSQPADWNDVKHKKVLWLCGNALRNILAQHDAVAKDPDPHYAKLPSNVAESIRRPVETWNIVILGDATLRDLDAQRLGPQESSTARDQMQMAKPVLLAAAADRSITTREAGAAVEATIAASEVNADNIHTRQAQELARGTTQNLIVQILRGAYRVVQDLRDPQTDEAKSAAKEYKAGIYKKLGEWTATGTVAAVTTASVAAGTAVYLASNAAYVYAFPFLEFVAAQSPLLKPYLAMAFQNDQLLQIVDFIVKSRARLVGNGSKNVAASQ